MYNPWDPWLKSIPCITRGISSNFKYSNVRPKSRESGKLLLKMAIVNHRAWPKSGCGHKIFSHALRAQLLGKPPQKILATPLFFASRAAVSITNSLQCGYDNFTTDHDAHINNSAPLSPPGHYRGQHGGLTYPRHAGEFDMHVFGVCQIPYHFPTLEGG